MEEIVMTAYELATSLVPFLAVHAIVRMRARHADASVARLIPALVFALYISAVLYVTGFGTLADLARALGGYAPRVNVNLVPFSDGFGIGTALNAVLFAPLGFLLPLVWRRGGRLGPVVGFGFALSLAIEVSQLLNNRATDIDDLLMNTLGTLVGFALFKFWELVATRQERTSARAAYPGNLYRGRSALLPGLAEPALYVTAMLAGYFLLYNGIGLAALVYGF